MSVLTEALDILLPKGDDRPSVVQGVVMLSPYVAPEHQRLLTEAERLLSEYTTYLAEKLEPKGTEFIKPHPSEYEKAQRAFLDDPFRQILIRNLVDIKLRVEKPRYLISTERLATYYAFGL